MRKQVLLLGIILLSIQYLFGQVNQIQKEAWADKPVIHVLDSKYSKEPAVVIYDSRRIEYTDVSKSEVAEYYTLHRIIHINDDRGIESFNKIYLGIGEDTDIVAVRARTILPGGKTITLDKSNIKEIKDDDGNVYKIFAMEGLEKGCEVEYLYTYKKAISYFGREILQENIPVLQTTFQIIAPARLRFEIKPYNFSVKSTDTLSGNNRIMQCSIKETPGVDDEKYAYYDANLYRIEFKLAYNDAVNKQERLFTWNELAKRIFAIYTNYNNKDIRNTLDIISANGWDKIGDEVSKIMAVENYVKKNFSYNEELTSEEGNNLENVIKNKTGGTIGIMRLYSAIFQSLGVNYQYVLSGNRQKFIIDRQFENWSNCDNPLFYFPAENKFIAPTQATYRYPWIFPDWGETNGLFCKKTTLGSFSTAIAEIKNVPLEDYKKSFEDIDSRLMLSAGLDSLTIDEKQIFGGYASMNYRDAFNFSNEEQKRTFIKDLTKEFANSENVLFSEVLNQDFEDENTNVPLILHTKTKSGELIERAGNKLLLKIGLAIGAQTEMYQDKPRKEPVDMEFAHVEERKIDFVIPDGYTIVNPDDLKIDQTYSDNGQLTMGFVSNYTIKGNVLSLHIIEQYRKPFYPLNQFAQFRKVINSSADFNKVVLVLQKKG